MQQVHIRLAVLQAKINQMLHCPDYFADTSELRRPIDPGDQRVGVCLGEFGFNAAVNDGDAASWSVTIPIRVQIRVRV